MRSTRYSLLEVPVRLHLEFNQMTIGELSRILREWQVVLRSAWRESYELQFQTRAPSARVLTDSASTKCSFDVVSAFAIPLSLSTSFLGPVYNWPYLARTACGYLGSVWPSPTRQLEREDSGLVFIRGGNTPELDVSVDTLTDTETGQRIERLWAIANSGSIRITVEAPSDKSYLSSSGMIEGRIARAEEARVTEDTLQAELSDGRTISVPLVWYPRLVHATQAERDNWELIGEGQGFHWPDLDEDISIEGLIAGRPSGESQRSFEDWL